MFQRRIPEWVRHSPAPSIRGFAILSGVEAVARGILISVFPIMMYRAYLDAALVSEIYFGIGVVSLIWGMLVPWFTRVVPRRFMFTAGAVFFFQGALIGASGAEQIMAFALLFTTIGVVTIFVCYNAYVLDYISKVELGNVETLRMFYSAIAWCVGPVLGVWLMNYWEQLPFIVAAAAILVLLGIFWYMRLGDGKLIAKAKSVPSNPFAYFSLFFKQPRLIAGWLFAVIRSCGWWVYVVYLPIYAVENGMSEQAGGIALSLTNGMLFITPLMLKWMQRQSIRYAVRVGFFVSGLAFIIATLTASLPWIALISLFVGSVFLILLDICGGLPFLMAVKPSQRTEMSAIYSSYRDVSGIITPGIAWLVLFVAPLSGIFAASGAGLLVAWTIAGRLHPRLGSKRNNQGYVLRKLAPKTQWSTRLNVHF